MKQGRTWILVIDSGHAVIYRNTGLDGPHQAKLVVVPDGSFRHERKKLYQSARPDIGQSSPSAGISFSVSAEDRHAHEEDEGFVTEVLAFVVSPQNMSQFEHLILAAPPRTLGQLRANMPKKLAAKVAHEIHADLTKTPVKELEARVMPLLYKVGKNS